MKFKNIGALITCVIGLGLIAEVVTTSQIPTDQTVTECALQIDDDQELSRYSVVVATTYYPSGIQGREYVHAEIVNEGYGSGYIVMALDGTYSGSVCGSPVSGNYSEDPVPNHCWTGLMSATRLVTANALLLSCAERVALRSNKRR